MTKFHHSGWTVAGCPLTNTSLCRLREWIQSSLEWRCDIQFQIMSPSTSPLLVPKFHDAAVDEPESAYPSPQLLVFTNWPCLTLVFHVWTQFWHLGKSSVGVKASVSLQAWNFLTGPIRRIKARQSKQFEMYEIPPWVGWITEGNSLIPANRFAQCTTPRSNTSLIIVWNIRMCCNGISGETKCVGDG